MNFNHEVKEDILIFRISGDLIGENSGPDLLEVAQAAMNKGIKNCITNISGLRYINSSGIGVLITLLTKFRNKGGELILVQPSEQVKKLLIITKLNAIFQQAENDAEAITNLTTENS